MPEPSCPGIHWLAQHKPPPPCPWKQEDIEEALNTLCTFLAEPEIIADVKRVALFCAQQYVMSMNLLEAFSVFENREHWAEELAQQSDEHPEEVQRFVARPNSDDALVRALSACLQTNMQQACESVKHRSPQMPSSIT